MNLPRSESAQRWRQPMSRRTWLIGCLVIFGAFFMTRLPNLLTLPLFIDEATHLTRAQDVWQGQPLELFLNGKAGPLYLIALFDPFQAPIWLGRCVIVLCGAIGVASVIGLGRALGSRSAGLLAGILWVCCPYLFFYERTILVDAPLAAFATFAAWTAVRMIRTGRVIDALLCGIALILCAFDKVTGLIFFALPVSVLLLPGLVSWRVLGLRIRQFAITYGLAALLMIVPVLLIISQQDNILGVGALTTTNTSTLGDRLSTNTQLAIGAFQSYFSSLFLAILVFCAVYALIARPRRSLPGLALFSVPMIVLIAVGQMLYLRYLVIAVPGLLMLAAIGAALISDQLGRLISVPGYAGFPWLLQSLAIIAIAVIVPFINTAYTDPTLLALPKSDQREYLTDWSGGYGLRDAALDLIARAKVSGQPLTVTGMVGSCNIVRLYVPADSSVTVQCPDVWDPTGAGMSLGEQEITTRRQTEGQALVLAEDGGPVQIDAVPQPRTLVQRYLRPGGAFTVELFSVPRQ